jgi:chromosomal replication initiator protein
LSCITAQDPQLERLANAIAQRVGTQRFQVWFNNSTKLDLRQDGLEIAVPNDFISEFISKRFRAPIQDAAHEVLGCSLDVRFSVMPQLFEPGAGNAAAGNSEVAVIAPAPEPAPVSLRPAPTETNGIPRSRVRHDIDTFVVGPSNQLAYNTALYVTQFPGAQYNPLFFHGGCGLGKTHLLQGLCRRFQQLHPAKRWSYITGEEFTNEFLTAMRANKLDHFRRKMRDLDLLAIDDVHFLGGKKATQEEFLHTFNAIEALGRQVVMASDAHPKQIEEFGESLINRFVSGMVVRIDPPNYLTRCEILRTVAARSGLMLPEEVTSWIARRVTQNVRELEGAVTRMTANAHLSGRDPDVAMARDALGDLDRHHVAPVKPDSIIQAVCEYFGVEGHDLMSNRRQRTISLARSLAMFLVRKTAKLSFPEIGHKMGKRNHSTVISACRRIERAVSRNEPLVWTSSVGERHEEAAELLQRLEEQSRAAG